jgi:hypothetical protein
MTQKQDYNPPTTWFNPDYFGQAPNNIPKEPDTYTPPTYTSTSLGVQKPSKKSGTKYAPPSAGDLFYHCTKAF